MIKLTPRQIAIIIPVALGKKYIDIAKGLNIANGSISSHLRRIYRKTGARNRTELTHFALKKGLVKNIYD